MSIPLYGNVACLGCESTVKYDPLNRDTGVVFCPECDKMIEITADTIIREDEE